MSQKINLKNFLHKFHITICFTGSLIFLSSHATAANEKLPKSFINSVERGEDVNDQAYNLLNKKIKANTNLRCIMQRVPINGLTFKSSIIPESDLTMADFYGLYKYFISDKKYIVLSNFNKNKTSFWIVSKYRFSNGPADPGNIVIRRDKLMNFNYLTFQSGFKNGRQLNYISQYTCLALPSSMVREDTSPIQ